MTIDNRKHYLTVLDTETTGLDNVPALVFPIIYDIGWLVADKKGNIVVEREFIVQEVFYNPIMQNAYYGSKIPYYTDRVTRADILVKPFREILEILNKDISLMKHNTLCAYNMNFDLRALRSTAIFCKILEKGEKDWTKLFNREVKVQDIWGLAVETILKKKWDYLDFIDQFGFLTESGNPKTSAEVVYKFLTNNPEYEELHTALEDCRIEYQIAIEAIRSKREYTKGIIANPWQAIAKLYKEYKGVQHSLSFYIYVSEFSDNSPTI